MHPVEIAGPRVQLCEFTPDDVPALHRIYGDSDATRHLSFPPRSAEEVAALITRIIGSARAVPRTEYALAVRDKVTGEAIGMARLELGDHASGQIGFALRPDHWHRGLGTEAVALLLELGFDHLGLHRIWGARSPANTASAQVMTRLGMVEEGRIRHHLLVRGAWRDSVVHSILEPEWRARRAAGDELTPPV